MDFVIRPSYVLALLLCLASTGNSVVIHWDYQRLLELQSLSRQTFNTAARVEITYEVVQIYKKYRSQWQSDFAQQNVLNAGVYNFESKIVLVEGVPRQGGGFTDFFNANSTSDNVKADGSNLAKSSSQALIDGIADYILHKA